MVQQSYMVPSDLSNVLQVDGLSSGARNQILMGLLNEGAFDAGPVTVQTDKDFTHNVKNTHFVSGLPANQIQVLETNDTIDSSLTIDRGIYSHLLAIVDDGSAALTVTGADTAGLIIALGGGAQNLTLADTGFDTVIGGAGPDVIYASDYDLITGGGGADKLFGDTAAGSHGHDTLVGGVSGNTSIYGSLGGYDSLIAGGGGNYIDDLYRTGTETIVAGAGADNIVAAQGDTFLDVSTRSNDTYTIWDNANNTAVTSTISLSGSDTVNFNALHGSDTITNLGGSDTIDFTGTNSLATYSSGTVHIAMTDPTSRVYTVNFTNGPSLTLKDSSTAGDTITLHFSNQNIII